MSDDPDVIVFKASIPPIKSAILISGDGNGGSLKLDIPEVEGNIFAELYRMRRHELIVTIARAAAQTLTELDDATKENPKREVARVDKRRAPK